jgi:hypothetical protein
MPGLLTLHTDLKSLKYGHDRPGGGDSGQPYITTDINTADTRIPFDDGFMRYGIVGATKASETDRLRISKFLYGGTQGYLFISRQIGLQFSNPKLEVGKLNIRGGKFLDFIGQVANRVNQEVGPTRIYNGGINTLAQVPVNAFGTHFLRHGVLTDQLEENKYGNAVTSNNEIGDNRLLKLTNKFQLGDNSPNITDSSQNLINRINRIVTGITNVFNTISAPLGGPVLPKFKLNPQEQIIDQYIGGPNSLYGVGQTTIRRYSNTEDGDKIQQSLERSKQFAGKSINNKNEPEEVNYTVGLGKGEDAISNYSRDIPLSSNDINGGINNFASIIPSDGYRNNSIQTYARLANQIKQQSSIRNPLDKYTSGSSTGYVNQFGIYNSENKAYSSERVGFIGYENSYGDVVKINFPTWVRASRENRVGSGRTDSINLTPLLSGLSSYWYSDDTKGISPDGETHIIRDLVKFCIQSVNTNTPNISDFMVFRAYLTNLSDSVDTQWNDVKYAGRGNPFYIYSGFTRKVQVGFKVAALSEKEMAPMYSKLNYLMASLMPDYKDSVMRGPLHRLTIGNYFDAQLGILNSLSYTVPNDSPWEIAIDEPEGGTKMLILPHVIEVSMTFTPIGAETQGENLIEDKNKKTSFIAQNNTGADASQIQYYHNWLLNNNYQNNKGNANTRAVTAP